VTFRGVFQVANVGEKSATQIKGENNLKERESIIEEAR